MSEIEKQKEKSGGGVKGISISFVVYLLTIATFAGFGFHFYSAINRLSKSLDTFEAQLDEMSAFQEKFTVNLSKMTSVSSNLNSSSSIEAELLTKSNQMISFKAAYDAIEDIKNGGDFTKEIEKIATYNALDNIYGQLPELQEIAKISLPSNYEIIKTLKAFAMQLAGNVTIIDDKGHINSNRVKELAIFKDIIKIEELKDVEFKNSLEAALIEIQEDDLDKAIILLRPIAAKHGELDQIIRALQTKVNAITLLEQIMRQITSDAN